MRIACSVGPTRSSAARSRAVDCAVADGERVAAVANLVLRAGASGALERYLEVHVLERETALHGESTQVLFVRRVRDDARFPSGWDLSQQIARDVVAATAALREETAAR